MLRPKEVVCKWVDAFNLHDVEAITSLYHKNAINHQVANDEYQTEALPHGESLQSFCVKHKVPYNIFQKWLKDIRKKIVEVQINGVPEIGHEEKSKTSDQSHPILQSKNDTPVRIWVDIRISNGLYLSQKNLSYPDWVRMVEKLEGLC